MSVRNYHYPLNNNPEAHSSDTRRNFNPLKPKLNPICHLLALFGAHHILHVSRVRVNAYPANVENMASS